MNELAPTDSEYLIPKHRWSAFHGTYLDLALWAFAARDFDYNLVISSDACTSPERDNHDQFMKRIFPRMARVRTTAAVVAMFLVAGCASMDRNECLSANWYAIGLEDGARGQPVERLGAHRRACAEHHVTPDAERYVAGRNEGLKSFCTYERGFSHGRSGQAYAGGCPPDTARNFQAGYELGRELYDVHRRLAEVQGEITRSKAALKDGIPNPRLRAIEVERLEDLTRESEQLEARVARLESR